MRDEINVAIALDRLESHARVRAKESRGNPFYVYPTCLPVELLANMVGATEEEIRGAYRRGIGRRGMN